MVDDYRLLRQAQLEVAESGHNRDEDYRLVTFKDWLRAYQWEQPPDTNTDTDSHDAAMVTARAIPEQRTSPPVVDPIDAARRAVSAIPDGVEVDTTRPLTSEAVAEEGRCYV